MDAKDFISAWDGVVRRERTKAWAAGVPDVADDLALVAAPGHTVESRGLPEDAHRFLVEAGLPGSCAPYLSFDAVASGPLPLVQYYGVHQFRPPDVERLASFFVLGSDGAGNPLCVDAAAGGEVVMLDHEDGFQTRTFVAASVASLARALVLIHTVPHAAFVEHLRSWDPTAADQSAFLPREVAALSLVNR
jgi:hypothetical protein